MLKEQLIYQSAYQSAQLMRDRTLTPEKRETAIRNRMNQVEDQGGSYLEFQECLSIAIQFLGEEQKGI